MRRRSPDDAERLRRIYVARDQGDVAYLIGALVDPDNRDAAARFLGKLGDRAAVPPLVRLLSVRDVHARRAAAIALGRLGDERAVPSLHSVASNDPDSVTRSWAIGALAEMGGDAALTALTTCLHDPSWWNRRITARFLGGLGDQPAIPELEKAMKAEPLLWRRPYRLAIRQIRARREAAKQDEAATTR